MKTHTIAIIAFFVAVTAFFFRPVVLRGYIPHPGDLLLAEYQPWRSYSIDGRVPGAIPNKAQYFDTLRQMYPWRTFTSAQLGKGIVPLWNPHNFSGAPLLANVQSAVLFPPSVLYRVLPQHVAWTVLVLLQPLLAMIATYIYARRVGLARAGALLASVSYGWCLYMSVFLEYNILGHFLYLLPAAILSVELLLASRRVAGFVGLAATIAFLAVAGHLQLFGGVLVFVTMYFFLRVMNLSGGKSGELARLSGMFAAAVTVGCGLAAAQLLPSLELLAGSARVAHSARSIIENLLITPQQLIVLLSPDFFGNPATKNYLLPFSYPTKAVYIGLIPLYFALAALFSKKNAQIKALSWMALAVAIVTFDTPVARAFYSLNIPVISASSPSNFLFLLAFPLAILAGMGLERLGQMGGRLRRGVYLGITTGLAVFTLWHTAYGLPFIKNSVIYAGGLAAVLGVLLLIHAYVRRVRRFVPYLLIAITVLDLSYFFLKFNPFVPPAMAYPKTEIGTWLTKHGGLDRVWGYGNAGIQGNFATQIGYYSPDGYDPLYPARYGEFIQSSGDGRIHTTFTDRTRSDAVITGGFGAADMMKNQFRLRVLAALGVRWILDKKENGSTQETFPPALFDKAAELGDWNVFAYKNVAPRAFLTRSVVVAKTQDEFARAFFAADFDPGKTIILPEAVLPDTQKKDFKGSVRVTSYEGNRVEIRTQSDADAILFLSDTYDPGWKAYVDELPVPVHRADWAFRAVTVPKGGHTVVFRYEPQSFQTGVIISVASLIVLGLVGFWVYNKKKA